MSHPNIDRDGVWRMSQPLKLYLFKDEESQDKFRVTDYMNIGRSMSEEHFQYICDNWREGVEGLETKSGKYYWYLSRSGPVLNKYHVNLYKSIQGHLVFVLV